MGRTAIEWTDFSVNPIRARIDGRVGHHCVKISPGCTNCYSSTFQPRFGLPQFEHQRDIEVFLDESKFEKVLRRRKPTKFFWCDMTDLFGEWILDEWVMKCLDVMRRAPQHVHQILTKRSERLLELDDSLDWPDNVWMGVSVENDRYTYRADHLRRTRARIKFLSVEPLIGPVPSLSLEGLDWVIVGGESGNGARPMELDWVREIRDKCIASDVALFLKQLGGKRDKRGKEKAVLDGRRWTEYPTVEDPDEQHRLFR